MEAFVQQIIDPHDVLTQDFAIFTNLNNWNIYSEYTFWLRVVRDHMMMINQKTSLIEDQIINTSQYLQNEAERLRRIAFNNVQSNTSVQNFQNFNQEVINLITQVKILKQEILDRHLTGQIKISLPSSLISHMLNELLQFQFIATSIASTGKIPPVIIGNHHELWQSDIVGHLDVIKCNLDGVEKILRKKVKHQQKIFEKIHNKILEFINYIKHGVIQFPAIQKLTDSSIVETLIYLNLVHEIYEMRLDKTALGILDPAFLLHMIFEEIYYLIKLQQAQPGFDPLMHAPIINPDTVKLISNIQI